LKGTQGIINKNWRRLRWILGPSKAATEVAEGLGVLYVNMLHKRVPGRSTNLWEGRLSGDREDLACIQVWHWRLGFGQDLFCYTKVVLYTVDYIVKFY
jgi:hypothetical protein